MSDFSRRDPRPELMDLEDVGAEEYGRVLAQLGRINRLTFGVRPTIRFLQEEIPHRVGARPLHIVDCGCADGQITRAVARWAAREGITAVVTGIDINAYGIAAARNAPKQPPRVRYLASDIFTYEPDAPIDIIVSSLFAHHLDDLRLPRFIEWMDKTARLGWMINDLRRSRFAHAMIWTYGRAAFQHRFIRHDGPLSVARSFVHDDWQAALARAGIDPPSATIRRFFPYRWGVWKMKNV
jgi:SAM-dependent methyltransferase